MKKVTKIKKLEKVELNVRLLTDYFGEGYFWRRLNAEMVGLNPKENTYIVIGDGMCFSDSWVYTIYKFDRIDGARDWAFNDYKYEVDIEGVTTLSQELFAFDGEKLFLTTARALDNWDFTHEELDK